jgi:hypothetical protein
MNYLYLQEDFLILNNQANIYKLHANQKAIIYEKN